MPATPEPPEQSPAAGAVLKTLLVSDLVDSTRLVEQLGDTAAAELLRRHERLARDLLAKHRGREIDKADGFLLLFERSLEAALYALRYHRSLRRLSEDQGRKVEARIGIHLAEVVLRENPPEDVARGAKTLEVEGLAKPAAARLMSLAQGGQTLLTRGAFDIARRGAVGLIEAEELRWLAHGAYRFKGLAEPVEVFEVGREGRAPLAPPADTEKVRRVDEQREITGWRPAPGLEIPHRSHWRVVEKLGEGGFGEVWLAGHYKTGDRRVLKFCYDLARLRTLQREITLFRLLREELGEREDITQILDWNFDQAPYFIESEYTAAGDLPQWFGAQRQVSLSTRLEIVAQVATALAAAHSVGVLHKDVKPSNVLIQARPEGNVQAQLTDFGVGLLIEQERLAEAGITVMGLTERSEETTGSSTSGTRLYMAPERLEGKPATLQADIYALGVLLYQFVAGDFHRSLGPGWRRDVEDQLLAEDIACLVDRSPARRPASAREVAERLRKLEARRAERKETEVARQALERSQRRRKLSAGIATVAVLVLAVVSVFAAWAMKTRREEEQARLTAERVSEFLVELFEVTDPFGHSDPAAARGETVTAREILDRGAAKLASEFDEEPLIRARLMNTVGDVYLSLALYDSAEPLIEKALAQRRQILGEENLDVAESLNSLAHLLEHRGDYEGAEPLLRESLAMRKRLLGDEHSDVAESTSNLAHWLQAKGDYDRAESLFRESLAMYRRLLGDEHADVASSLSCLGRLLQAKGDYEGAEPLFRESLAILRRLLDDEHPSVGLSLNNLAGLLQGRGDYQGAEPLYRQSLAMYRRLLGDEHPRVASSLSNLAVLLWSQGDYQGAEPLFRESLAMNRRLLGNEHPSVASSLHGLAVLLQFRGDYQGAEPLYRENLAMRRRLLGDEHPSVASSLHGLAALLQAKGDYQGAEPLYRQSLAMLRRLLGDEHPSVATSLNNLASLLVSRESSTEGEALIREALAIYLQALPPGHWRILNAESILGAYHTGPGRFEEAESLLLRSYPTVKEKTGARSPYTRDVLGRLVTLYEAWGKPAKATEYRALWVEAGGSAEPE